jgi:hypothetical protein
MEPGQHGQLAQVALAHAFGVHPAQLRGRSTFHMCCNQRSSKHNQASPQRKLFDQVAAAMPRWPKPSACTSAADAGPASERCVHALGFERCANGRSGSGGLGRIRSMVR